MGEPSAVAVVGYALILSVAVGVICAVVLPLVACSCACLPLVALVCVRVCLPSA